MPVTVDMTFTDAEAIRIRDAQEAQLGNPGLNQAEHVAIFKAAMLRVARQYVRKLEYKANVAAVAEPDEIVGT